MSSAAQSVQVIQLQQSHVLCQPVVKVVLPNGWRKVVTPDGKVYYQNDATHQTQWDAPQSVSTIVYLPVSNAPNPQESVVNALPSDWRKVNTSDGKPYYQNDITHQTQWDAPQSVATIVDSPVANVPPDPPISDDNSVSQNNFSVPRVSLSISSHDARRNALDIRRVDIHAVPVHIDLSDEEDSTSAVALAKSTKLEQDNYNPEDNTSNVPKTAEIAIRKWWHKDHIIWFISLVLNIFDFITDVEVAVVLITLNTNACPQFNCAARSAASSSILGWLLIICADIGFIYNLIRSRLDAKKLYRLYKNQVTKSDVNSTVLSRYRRELYMGWIPLLVENCFSIFIIEFAWSEYYTNIKGPKSDAQQAAYSRSLALSVIGVCGALIVLLVKRRKLSRSEEHQKGKVYRKVLTTHCTWCTCLVLLVSGKIYLILMYLGDLETVDASPIVDISNEREECLFYNDLDGIEQLFGTQGDIIGYPEFIYDGCDGRDYNYDLYCRPHLVLNVQDMNGFDLNAQDSNDEPVPVLLHCELSWDFTGNDFSDCNHAEDVCAFDLNVEVCGNYPISCDNFDFLDGNPLMWACFDYCIE
eukprot:305068_1